MDVNSFVSYSNYFDRLRHKTREIDEGIDKLTEIWKTPHLLIGGYAERTAETNAYLEELWQSIRSTDDAVEASQLEFKPSLEKTDEFLKDCRTLYGDLKEQCDNLDTVLAEFGYHCQDDNDSAQQGNNCIDHANANDLMPGRLPDMEIEFTPNLTWKCKARSKEFNNSTSNLNKPPIKGIATPVIKSVASVMKTESSAQRSLISGTSKQEFSCSKYSTKVSRK